MKEKKSDGGWSKVTMTKYTFNCCMLFNILNCGEKDRHMLMSCFGYWLSDLWILGWCVLLFSRVTYLLPSLVFFFLLFIYVVKNNIMLLLIPTFIFGCCIYLKNNVGLTIWAREWNWSHVEDVICWNHHCWCFYFTCSCPCCLECLHCNFDFNSSM